MARFTGILSAQELRELKRNEIVRHASILFAANGYRNTSLSAVAAGVGVTKTALYHYVASKEELLFLCQKAVAEQGRRITEEAAQAEEKPLFQLYHALSGLLRAMTGLGIPYTMTYEIFNDSLQINDQQAKEIRSLRDRIEHNVRSMVQAAVDDGSFKKGTDSKLAGFMLLGAVVWVTRWFHPGGEWSPEFVADSVPRLALRSFMADPGQLDIQIPAIADVSAESRTELISSVRSARK